jgi:radical SAM protein (TIGR01212 family)
MATVSVQKPINDYAAFLRERYGENVYRVPVDAGWGCPNRDASGAGCAFCTDAAARAVHLTPAMCLEAQVRKGIELARERYNATGFLAYFQAGTSTNAPAHVLEQTLAEILEMAPFKGVIISTRPDCLPADTLDVLADLAASIDTWVELGVQSANDQTLRRINRGHTFETVVTATNNLAERGIQVAPHVILGLPGESSMDMRRTAYELGRLPFSAIKIHNLHILAGSQLADLWRSGEIRVWDEHEYGEVLIDFLRRIPARWPVMRLVTDSPGDALLAPRWWMSKGQFIQYVERQMTARKWQQGDLEQDAETADTIQPAPSKNNPAESNPLPTDGLVQHDDTQTLALDPPHEQDRRKKTQLLRRLKPVDSATKHDLAALLSATRLSTLEHPGRLVVLAIGFGQGPLALEATQILPRMHTGSVRLIGLGTEPALPAEVRRQFPNEETLMSALLLGKSARFDWGSMRVYWGDPRRYVFRIRGMADIILLEPADIDRCVQLYTLDFLRRLGRVLKPDGIVLTAASAMPLRGALGRLGLTIGTAPTARGQGTVASWTTDAIRQPIGTYEKAILRQTLSGIPYRDHRLVWSRKHIIQHRQSVLARMRERGWPKRLPKDIAAVTE